MNFTDEGKSEVNRKLATDFFSFVSPGNSQRILNWLRFQFKSDHLAHIFRGGKNTDDDLWELIPHLEKFRKASARGSLYKLIGEADLKIPTHYDNALRHFHYDKALFGLAYIFHAFRRGYFYAVNLPSEPIYRPHWIREPAVTGRLGKAVWSTVGSIRLFNWGKILEHVFDPFQGLEDFQIYITPLLRREIRRVPKSSCSW